MAYQKRQELLEEAGPVIKGGAYQKRRGLQKRLSWGRGLDGFIFLLVLPLTLGFLGTMS